MNTQNTNENALIVTENSQVDEQKEQKGKKINRTAMASIAVLFGGALLVTAKLLNWPPFGKKSEEVATESNSDDEMLDDTSDDDEEDEE